jgi:hypothetical protein
MQLNNLQNLWDEIRMIDEEVIVEEEIIEEISEDNEISQKIQHENEFNKKEKIQEILKDGKKETIEILEQERLENTSKKILPKLLNISDKQDLKKNIINTTNSNSIVSEHPSLVKSPSLVALSMAQSVVEKNTKILTGGFSGVDDVLDLIVNKNILNEFCICLKGILKNINSSFTEIEQGISELKVSNNSLSSSSFSAFLIGLQNLSVGVVSTTIPLILGSPFLPLDVSSQSLLMAETSGSFLSSFFSIFYFTLSLLYDKIQKPSLSNRRIFEKMK